MSDALVLSFVIALYAKDCASYITEANRTCNFFNII